MTLPNTFGTIATGTQEPGSALDANFQGVGSSVVVQCTASGTNAIALTEVTNAYQPTAYANYQLFSFVAPNNSTASVTLQYRGLAQLPWYKAGATPAAETQLGNGDVIQSTYYIVAYNSALNAGAGGFTTVSALASGAGSLILLGSATASNSTALTFTSLISATYDMYVLFFAGIIPVTNTVVFQMRVSENNGSSYLSTANYGWCFSVANTGGTTSTVGNAADTSITIAVNEQNGATQGLSGTLVMGPMNSTTVIKPAVIDVTGWAGGPAFVRYIGGEQWSGDTNAINALQFFFSSGNISAGTIYLYGVRKS